MLLMGKIFLSSVYFNSYHGNTSTNTEVGSSVTSVLEELKKDYSSMRAKIQMGTPLSTLPPLSVEIKLLPIVSSYVPYKVFLFIFCLFAFNNSFLEN